MKKYLLTSIIMLLSGCCSGPWIASGYHRNVNGSFWDPPENNVITVVNNTDIELDMVEDGHISHGLIKPGEQLSLRIYCHQPSEELTLTASGTRAVNGRPYYAGSVMRVFYLQSYGRLAHAWKISSLSPPGN
jgi:hypothetical protein